MLLALSTIVTLALMALDIGASKTAGPLAEIKAMAPTVQVVMPLAIQRYILLIRMS